MAANWGFIELGSQETRKAISETVRAGRAESHGDRRSPKNRSQVFCSGSRVGCNSDLPPCSTRLAPRSFEIHILRMARYKKRVSLGRHLPISVLRQIKHQTSNIKHSAAFTLLELLVVMGIIAIVLGFLIPSLGTGSGRSAEAAARQLSADLDGARL